MGKPKKDPEFCHEVRNRIEKWDKYWKTNRDLYHEWTLFVLGDQWREDESRLFERYNKIPLTNNKLGALMNHLLGDQRQNTPALQITPEDQVEEQTAEIRAALVKNIALDSDSKRVYQWAFQCAVIGGYGAYGIKTAYAHNYSFDLEIKYFEIRDPTRAYWDISAESPCKTDGMYAGYKKRISRKKFRGIYGKKIEQSIGVDALNNDTSLNFADDDSITVIYDFEREYDSKTIYLLSNGKVIDDERFKELERRQIDETEVLIDDDEPVTVMRQRENEFFTVKSREIAGDWILDEEDFPSEQLPLVYVDQNSYWDKNGQQITRPFFKDVKDAQRYINYLQTQSAYILKVSRYDQFLISKANVRGADTEAIWRDPSTIQGGLVYDESPNGNKPEQLRPPELSQSLANEYQRAMMDIQSGTGMYNTQLGENGNEVSGRAVEARSKRGSYNTFVPFDSLNLAIACGGTIVNEMIPKVYDAERLLMLKMNDGNTEKVTLNKQKDDYGSGTENDMGAGRYKIRLMPGPSYEGQQEEALESMEMVLKNDPSLFRLIGDLFVENLPLKNNIELRNRIRTIIPPEIIEAGKTGKPVQKQNDQPNPEQQALMAEQQHKMAELQFKMQEAEREVQFKMKEFEMEEAKLQMQAHETGQNIQLKWQDIESKKQEQAAKLQEQILRYQAEMQKISADMQKGHGQNIVKLLTHHPKEEKPKPHGEQE